MHRHLAQKRLVGEAQGSLNGTHFGGGSRLMQIYGNVEGIFR